MYEPCPNDIVGGGVVPQLTGEDAGGVLLLHELMAVEHLECVLVNDEERVDLLLLATLSLSRSLATPDEAAQAAAGGAGQGLGGGRGPAGLETILGVNINPAGDHSECGSLLLVGNAARRLSQWDRPGEMVGGQKMVIIKATCPLPDM